VLSCRNRPVIFDMGSRRIFSFSYNFYFYKLQCRILNSFLFQDNIIWVQKKTSLLQKIYSNLIF
jgi:hypothetical protein